MKKILFSILGLGIAAGIGFAAYAKANPAPVYAATTTPSVMETMASVGLGLNSLKTRVDAYLASRAESDREFHRLQLKLVAAEESVLAKQRVLSLNPLAAVDFQTDRIILEQLKTEVATWVANRNKENAILANISMALQDLKVKLLVFLQQQGA